MFPANEFVIAAEDAYRRERMIAVRPHRRSRRTRQDREAKPLRRHGLRRLLVLRTGAGGQSAGPSLSRPAVQPTSRPLGPSAGQGVSQSAGQGPGVGADSARAA